MSSESSSDPTLYWQSLAGDKWVRNVAQTDAQLAPFGSLALDALHIRVGQRVLDVGCGAGATTVELGRRVGASGRICGIDISPPMLESGRERAAFAGLDNLSYVLGDAQVYPFERAFDALFSRFGVMFFRDTLAAFKNLRRALKPRGRVAFVCWQGLARNPWASVLLDAVVGLTPGAAVPAMCEPGKPGPFAFADAAELRTCMTSAGFAKVGVKAESLPLTLGGLLTLDEAVEYSLDIGPAGRVLEAAGVRHRAQFRDALRNALAPYAGPTGVTLESNVFVVTAGG